MLRGWPRPRQGNRLHSNMKCSHKAGHGVAGSALRVWIHTAKRACPVHNLRPAGAHGNSSTPWSDCGFHSRISPYRSEVRTNRAEPCRGSVRAASPKRCLLLPPAQTLPERASSEVRVGIITQPASDGAQREDQECHLGISTHQLDQGINTSSNSDVRL